MKTFQISATGGWNKETRILKLDLEMSVRTFAQSSMYLKNISFNHSYLFLHLQLKK